MSHSDEKVKMSDNGLRIEEKMCYKGTQFFGVSIGVCLKLDQQLSFQSYHIMGDLK